MAARTTVARGPRLAARFARAAMALIVLTGCGSTVQIESGQAVQDPSFGTPGLSAPTSGPVGTLPSNGGTTGGSSTGVSSSGPGLPGSTGGTTGTNGTTGQGATTGVALPTGDLKIGIVVDGASGDAANSSTGSSVSNGDAEAQARALVADLNRTGGIGGRKVVAVYGGIDFNSATPLATQEQTLCELFARDKRVQAVISPMPLTSGTLTSCLDKAGIVSAWDNLSPYAGADMPATMFLPSHMRIERIADTYGAVLASRGFFPGGEKIGLIRFDQRAMKTGAGVLRAALKRAGHTIDEEVEVHAPASTADYGPTVSATQAAALRFASRGIKRVLFLDESGRLSYFFLLAAQAQQLKFTYAFTSLNAPTPALAEDGSLGRQLEGSVGVGWIPLADVRQEEASQAPAYANCLRIVIRAGIKVDSGAAKLSAANYCDGLLFLKASYLAAPSEGFRAGAARLGSSFASAVTFRTTFSAARRDGASTVRPFAYVTACSCFKYNGPQVAAS